MAAAWRHDTMITAMLKCASLTAVDGDTVRCDWKPMRLLGGGVPFQWGIDTPEIGSHAKCIKERKMALIAKGRLKERLEERGLQIEIKGYDDTPKHRMGKRSGPNCSRGDLPGHAPHHKNDSCTG